MELIIKPDENRTEDLTDEDIEHFLKHSLFIEEHPTFMELAPTGEYYVTFDQDRIFSDGGVFDHNDMIEVPASLELPSHNN